MNSLIKGCGLDRQGAHVREVAAIPGSVRIGIGAEPRRRGVAGADPLDHDLPRDDLPLAVAPLEPVDVAAAGHVDDLLVLAKERADAVRLRVCDVAVEVDGVGGQMMLMRAPVSRVQLVRPGDEIGRLTKKAPVVIGCPGVVGGRDHLIVVPVEPAGVPVDAVGDCLAVEELSQLWLKLAHPWASAACAPAMRPNVTPRITDVPTGYSL